MGTKTIIPSIIAATISAKWNAILVVRAVGLSFVCCRHVDWRHEVATHQILPGPSSPGQLSFRATPATTRSSVPAVRVTSRCRYVQRVNTEPNVTRYGQRLRGC